MHKPCRSFLFVGALTFALGCFPEAQLSNETETDETPPESPPPFGTLEQPALSEGVVRDVTAECPSVSDGLVADMLGLGTGARLGVGAPEILGQPDARFLRDGFALDVAIGVRDRPLAAGCLQAAIVGEGSSSGAGVVGRSVRHAADLLGDPAWRALSSSRGDFEAAVGAVCARYLAESGDVAECASGQGQLPDDLAEALEGVMWAIHDGVVARLEMDADLMVRTPDWWRDQGSKGLLASLEGEGYSAAFPEDRSYLARARGKLFGAAAAIADAVDAVEWSTFEGRTNVRYDRETPAGWIQIRGAGPDAYPPSDEDVLLRIDLGGDDRYLDETASNTSGSNAVSVVIDLAGADSYGYEEAVGTPTEAIRLPADRYGRLDVPGQIVRGSASDASRQGAARNGIAMLFDLGDSADRYVALRASQGYASQGVGVLFDAGGADLYIAEHTAQGAGQFGIGLLIDVGGGDDLHRSSHASQGFGYVGGVGWLLDDGGSDLYECHPDHDGQPAYIAPQMPGEANASMCQGAGLGFRIRDEDFSLAGGLGLLVDEGGDDRYLGGVFAQGVGYWQGLGLLVDADGSDSYDAFWYAQGAAAHFGVGVLADGGGGADRVGTELEARTMVMGAAEDFSVGVFVNQEGDDTYVLPPMAAGAASCGSVTLFVDNEGVDRYVSLFESAAGVANGTSCGDNRGLTSTATFLDVGGEDLWELPGPHQNNERWGITLGDGSGAEAYAQDVTSGDSGVHLGSSRR